MVEFVLTLAPGFEASRQGGAFAPPIVDIVFGNSSTRLLTRCDGTKPVKEAQ